MERTLRLLRILADGRFHSGEDLGAVLGVSRAAVWQHLKRLQDLGVTMDSVPGRGYRLNTRVDLLEAARILAHVSAEVQRRIADLVVLPSVDSTNRWVGARAGPVRSPGTICLAEHQTAGRGRRGRAWRSPFARNLYCSVLWEFPQAPAALGGLSLVVGLALCDALKELGAGGIGLKWPNDVLAQGRKLGGVLLEVEGESNGPTRVVVGIGLNLNMEQADIDQPWTTLRHLRGGEVDRNRAAGRVLQHLLPALDEFERTGFSGFRSAWHRYDLVSGKQVRLNVGAENIYGTAAGVDEAGALLLEVPGGGCRRFFGGEISLRLESE